MEASEQGNGDQGQQGSGSGSGSGSSGRRSAPAPAAPPAPAPAPAEDTFSVSRLLGPDGVKIAAASGAQAENVDANALAGAFHDREPDDELTRAEIAEAVDGFYAHVDTTGQED